MPRRAVRRRALMLISLAFVACGASGAENWPGTKPFRFETVASAGGITDLVPRTLSGYLSASLAVPVVVENRPGGAGNVASAVVAKAAPDGHTILVTGVNQVVNPTLLPNPGFDYERDLAPVSMAVSAKLLLVASLKFPVDNIADIIKIGRKAPKSVSVAVTIVGSPAFLAAEMLSQLGKVDLTLVPYEGTPQALPDLISNRVNLAFGAISTLLPQVRSGAVKALAVISPQRSPLAPDIPTSAEAGLPELQLDNWICFMTTGGTPAPIVARLDTAVAKVLMLPEVGDAFTKQGVDIFYMNAQQLGPFLHAETARFGNLLKHSRLVKLPR
jgi:tripartite-type tricarboxylate transporter receptor subunit TctC